VVAITIARAGSKEVPFLQPTSDDPDAIPEQGGVRGIMDVALNDG